MDHQRGWIMRLVKKGQNTGNAAGMCEVATSPSAVGAASESTVAAVPGNIAVALPS